MSSPLAALYNAAPIILWVEDLTTSYYLDTVWQHAGTWTPHISGKELLAELISHIYTKGRPRGDAARQDLARAVGDAQVATGRVPVELLELRDVMLERLARTLA